MDRTVGLTNGTTFPDIGLNLEIHVSFHYSVFRMILVSWLHATRGHETNLGAFIFFSQQEEKLVEFRDDDDIGMMSTLGALWGLLVWDGDNWNPS